MFTTTTEMVLSRRFRLVATAFAALLGVAFMAGTLTLTDTVTKSLNHLVANANQGTDAWVRALDQDQRLRPAGPGQRR
jgi:hypothetical protein